MNDDQRKRLSEAVKFKLTAEQEQFVRGGVGTYTRKSIATYLGTSIPTINRIIADLGLNVPDSQKVAIPFLLLAQKKTSGSGAKIDWSLYDTTICRELPNYTVEEFTKRFISHLSSKTISKRANKLGIQPAQYKPTDEHKAKISQRLRDETPELVEQIRQLRDTVSINNLYKQLGITKSLLNRIIARHNIRLSVVGTMRALTECQIASIGNIPWNKGSELSDETKAKISIAISGEKNGQYGRGMTEEEKEKWRTTYRALGVHKMREYFKTPKGMAAMARTIANTQTPEFRARSSKIMANMITDGKFQPHSHHAHGYYESTKLCRSVHYKSSWELTYYQFLDACDEVADYVVEPFTISYFFNGCMRNYFPDVLVEYQDGHWELVEIKPSRLLTQPKNVAKLGAGGAYATEHNLVFVVISEEELAGLV